MITSGSVSGPQDVKLNSIDGRVLVDRPGVRGTLAQRLAVRLAGPSDVLPGDRHEWDKLDGIDLDLSQPDPVAAALPDPWPLPQSDRESDISGQDVVTQFAAELHVRDRNGDSMRAARELTRPRGGWSV